MQFDIDHQIVTNDVAKALQEDIGQGDITASLIPETAVKATIISREPASISGTRWVDEVFHQVDTSVTINWHVEDGDRVAKDTILCQLIGSARQLLIGERTALNFLQTLSGTATVAQQYADAVVGLEVKVLDTRKTIPGLRVAQKYATLCGGCHNHRFGLYDGILIKENHILAAGSIANAVQQAKAVANGIAIEVEVENFAELEQALAADADIILLDNFSTEQLTEAVKQTQGKALLEASGGISLNNLRQIAETGVDRISIGALTKDVKAIDLSMRFNSEF